MVFDLRIGRKGCCSLFFDSTEKIFDVYPTPDYMFLESLDKLGAFGVSIKNEFNKIQDQSSVLPVLIVPNDENTGVFFGFDIDSGEIPNWLIDESFDFEFFKKVVDSHFLISGNSYTKKITLRFCEGEV
jgi:hypothetical protein